MEIEFQNALRFILRNVDCDEWLEEYFPKQMAVYHQAIQQTREQFIKQLNNAR